MKKFILLAMVGSLSACGVGVGTNGISVGLGVGGMIGRHIGLGTSVNIPLTINKKQIETAQTNNPSINVIEEKIVTYFDAQGNPTETPAKGGYYRQLIRKDGSQYLVQDFYATGEKRTDPMLLDRSNIFTFRAHPKTGAYTVYAINGVIMTQSK